MDENRDHRVEYFALMGFMADAPDRELNDIAFKCQDYYFDVKNSDGSLNKEKFENRIKEIEEYRVDHMYLPAVESIDQNQKAHSDYWLRKRFMYDSEYGAVQNGLLMALTGELQLVDDEIDDAYGNENKNSIFGRLCEDRRGAAVFAESEELQEKVENAARFFAYDDDLMKGKSKEYVAEQKQIQKHEVSEPEKESRERYFSHIYKLFAGKDMSFLDDKEYHKVQNGMLGYVRKELKNPEWTPTDPADKSLYELSTTIDGLAEELKNASGYRFSDSSKFNAVKDRVAEIQKQIKGGSSLENREALFASVTKLSGECQAYLDKNAGERFTKRGNVRKDIVGRLKALAEEQKRKLRAPEMEPEMQGEKEKNLKQVEKQVEAEQKVERKAGQKDQCAADMEKLLVISGESRETAKNQVQEAFADLDKNPENSQKMEDVLTKCRHEIGRMNVRNEALKELGVAEPEKLDKAQMRAILTAPENQNKLNDFYASVSDLAYHFTMEGTHPSLQVVLRGMEQRGRLEPDRNYERASAAMIKGLGGEREWKQARAAYAAGERSMDTAKMAALKTSLKVQRELILENGVLSGQSRVQTDMMENLAEGTEKIITIDPAKDPKIPTDHRKAAEGLMLKSVMEGYARMPEMERAVASAIGLKGSSVQSARLKDLGEAQNMKQYEPTTHITQLDRAGTNNNLVAFYMKNQGYDQNTIFDDPAARAKAAKEFKDFIATHGSELDENKKPKTEKDRKNLEELGKFYKDSQIELEKMRIPDIDFSDPIQRAAHQFELTSLARLMIDLDQNMTNPSKLETVQEVFGGKDKMVQKSTDLVKVQMMLHAGKRDNGSSQFNDFEGLVFGELYGKAIAGKTVGEVRDAFKNVSKEAVYMAGNTFFTTHLEEAGKFLSGEKKVTLDDAIQSCVKLGFPEEMFQPLKDTVNALTEKQPAKQKPEAKLGKTDFKSLMEAEGKSAPSRKSAGPEIEKKSPEHDRRKFMGSVGK